jgi:small-conductance mechanosensitive channel/CRP-like cAMP-binding protein
MKAPRRNFRLLIIPVVALALLGLCSLLLPRVPRVSPADNTIVREMLAALPYALYTCIWFAFAWLLIELIEIFIWQNLAGTQRVGVGVPRLLKHVVALLVFTLASAAVLHFVFGRSITALWATSGVVGLVVGFATRSLIADFFSGIALSLDPPFRIGDYVELRLPGDARSIYGSVAEMNWRSTRLHTRNNTRTLYIPNAVLSTMIIVNIYRHRERSRFEVLFAFEQSVSVDQATRVLLAGVLAAPGVLETPSPEVLINNTTDAGIEYRVRYWIGQHTSASQVRHHVLESVLRALATADLALATTKRDNVVSRKPARHTDPERIKLACIGRLDLFRSLQPAELAALSTQVCERLMKSGDTVMRQGEPGQSMYVVLEGLLDVLMQGEAERPVRVSRLRAGEFFGEMSLLTGEPRSATVVAVTGGLLYEIAKESLQPIISARPEVVSHITQVLAERRFRNERLFENLDTQQAKAETKRFGAQLLSRMREFFGGSR